MKTGDFIAALAADNRAALAAAAQARRVRSVSFLAGTAGVAVLFLMLIGPRRDFTSPAALIATAEKLALMGALVLAAAVVMRALARPLPVRAGLWRALLVPFALALGFCAIEAARLDPALWPAQAMGRSAGRCLGFVGLLSLIPLGLLLSRLRVEAPAEPARAGFAAGLVAGGFGGAIYALNCFEDSALFVALWYGTGALLAGLAGALLGRRVLAW